MMHHGEHGFTLIEAMIAVLVLSFGLLGIASIQILSLRSTTGSYGRSQATLAAYDIVDRMRANAPAFTSDRYQLDPAAPPANPGINNDCTTGPCTVAEMAQTDLATWLTSLSATSGYDLANGTARITCLPSPSACASGSIVEVTVMWDEQRSGATGTACSADLSTDLTCFRVSMSVAI